MSTYIRCSSLSGYADCPRRAIANGHTKMVKNLGYDLNDYRSGVASVVGTSVHKGMEVALHHKKSTGEIIKVKECVDSAVSEFDEIIKKEDSAMEYDSKTANVDDAHTQISRLSKAHHKFFLPDMEPQLIEERFMVDLGDDFILSGQPDHVDQNGNIDDLKTGAVAKNAIGQLGGYAILCVSNGVEVGESLNIQGVPRSKKIIKPYSLSYNPKLAQLVAWEVINKIKSDFRKFNEDQKPSNFAANTSSMLCSDKYCRAYGTKFCPATFKNPTKRELL